MKSNVDIEKNYSFPVMGFSNTRISIIIKL